MVFKNFERNVTTRVTFVFLSTLIAAWLLASTEYYVATVVLTVITALQVFTLIAYVKTTNREVSRFLDAVRNSDFSQTFHYTGHGDSFAELGEAFTMVLDRFRATRSENEEQGQYLRILVDHIPVALLSVQDDGAIEPLNNAARRLFGANFPATIEASGAFGPELQEELGRIEPGQSDRVKLVRSRSEQELKIAATEITVQGRRQRIISLQDIQSELDAREFEAWGDMGRVLTHELMNSLTPVSSLASTARDLLDDASEKVAGDEALMAELGDARDAVDAVARRSEGLLNFVENYRKVMRVPPPDKIRFGLSEVCERITRLMSGDLEARGIKLTCDIEPKSLELDADPDQLEQTLINLIKNALDAISETQNPEVSIEARLNERNQVVITVADNGPGIPADQLERIFVPFYTTKKQGAGIGLSLCRQIMLGHGGSIDVESVEGKGTGIHLRFG